MNATIQFPRIPNNIIFLIILLIISIFSLSRCTTLKSTQATTNTSQTVKQAESKAATITIDTTKISSTTTEIVQLQFYSTSSDSNSSFRPKGEISQQTNQSKTPQQPTPSTLTINNKQFPANIKSATITTITKNTEQKGLSKTDSTTNRTVNKQTTQHTKTITQPAKDPKRFMWIFGILVLVIGIVIFLCIQFKPFFQALHPLDFIKKVFK